MTIAEVSRKYGISADTLRYYEKAGLLRNIPRTKSGLRDYDEGACQSVEFVKCMRGAGISVEALAEYISLFEQGDATVRQRKELLMEQREQLVKRIAEQQEALARLDYKIRNYERLFTGGGDTCREPEKRSGK